MDERPDQEADEPIEAVIYFGIQKPTEPYKRSPRARPLETGPRHVPEWARSEIEARRGSRISFLPTLREDRRERLEKHQSEHTQKDEDL